MIRRKPRPIVYDDSDTNEDGGVNHDAVNHTGTVNQKKPVNLIRLDNQNGAASQKKEVKNSYLF